MLAQVEQEGKPIITAAQAACAGCSLSLFGLTVLSASVAAMQRALQAMRSGPHPTPLKAGEDGPAGDRQSTAPVPLMDFGELKTVVGFDGHDAWEKSLRAERVSSPESKKRRLD